MFMPNMLRNFFYKSPSRSNLLAGGRQACGGAVQLRLAHHQGPRLPAAGWVVAVQPGAGSRLSKQLLHPGTAPVHDSPSTPCPDADVVMWTAARDLHCSAAMSRKFFWTAVNLTAEQLPARCAFVCGGGRVLLQRAR